MKPVRRQLMTEMVMERIADYIREHKLGPGDKLPNEKALIETLGVSRPTLREALRSLAVTGLIDLQPGSGIFVGSHTMLSLMAHGPVPSLLTTADELQEFIEARRVLEPELAALAAVKATEEDLKELESILQRMENTVAEGIFDDLPWVDFHGALFRAAHNRLLLEMTTPIVQLLSQVTPYMITAQGERRTNGRFEHKIEVHRMLYDAVRSRDPNAARQAALDHVEGALAALREAIALKQAAEESRSQITPAAGGPRKGASQ
jgi:GntR family transcriptional repressor for pyruvate dehydrogenase complex